MAKVYIETIPSASYSKTTWIDTALTTYYPGDRVSLSDSLFVHGGGTIDNSHNRIYVCIRENDSQTYPFQEAINWVLAGSSEEHPCYAVNGSICTSNNNEVYLEHESGRYSGLGANRFTWNQATAQGTEHGELIFADGEYSDNQKGFTIDKLSFTAKNKGKVTINAVGFHSAIFQGNNALTQLDRNALEVSMMTGIKFIISGTKFLHRSNEVFGFDSCIITDQGAGTAYTPSNFRVGDGNSHLNVKNTVFNLPNTALKLVGYQAVTHRGNLFQIKNSTFYMGEASSEHTPLTLNADTGLEISQCIFAFITSTHSSSNAFKLGAPLPSKDNLIYCYDSSVPAPAPDDGTTDGVCIVADPLFINRESGDLRLRPSSPVIGGIAFKNKQSEVENQYPQGKWFDSNAAAGGDGSWETPYNNYGEAINSFTGDEAVILVKEGEHPLYAGFWNGSTWATSNDLTKVYSSGVKIIGMGKDSTFTAGSEVSGWPTFYSSSDNGAHNPNLIDTPFLLKDFTILLTSPTPYNRSLWTLRKGTMINVHVKPKGPGLGNSGANLFDYNMSSATGDYLHMSSCTIEVTFDTGSGNFCSPPGQKQFSNCTFIDPNHTRNSTIYPKEFLGNAAGNVAGSFIKDCIFYTKSPGFNNTGASNTLCQLSNTVFYSTQDELTLSSGTNKTNCAIVDPRFVNDNGYEAMDLRLRADSPLIGGITKHPSASTSIWYVDLIGGDDANNGKTPDTAMLTISAAHAASIHLDTIFIVNENISVSSDLDFPGGRKYESLTKCTIGFNDNYSSSISAAAGLDTYIKGFDFIKMRGDYSLLSISSDANSLFVIENCKFEGILTNSQSAPIGGNGTSSRGARRGSIIKGCTFDIGWTTQTSGGSTSCGFIAVDRTDIVGCTFWVKDSTPLGSTNLYLVGTGGVGAWSHGPPLGPVEVKNCIVHGNNRMHYGIGSGGGGNLGFTSNARVTPSNANYVIHHCCLYGINGPPMDINNTGHNDNKYNIGSVASDRSIPLEWIENIFTEDPKLVDPGGGNFALKADSPLIGQGK